MKNIPFGLFALAASGWVNQYPVMTTKPGYITNYTTARDQRRAAKAKKQSNPYPAQP